MISELKEISETVIITIVIVFDRYYILTARVSRI